MFPDYHSRAAGWDSNQGRVREGALAFPTTLHTESSLQAANRLAVSGPNLIQTHKAFWLDPISLPGGFPLQEVARKHTQVHIYIHGTHMHTYAHIHK